MSRKKKKNLATATAGAPTKPIELTFDQRTMMANTQAEAALGVFHIATLDLEEAAAELDKVSMEAGAEMDRLMAIQTEAEDGAWRRRDQAQRIRTFMDGSDNA